MLLVGAVAYTATGGAARELLVQELLINLVLVLGLQAFIGSTGILSFGHLAFTQIAAYGAAIVAIPVATKSTRTSRPPVRPRRRRARSRWRHARRRRRRRRHRRRRRCGRRPCRRAGGDDDHVGGAVRRRPGGQELAGADARCRRPVGRAADRDEHVAVGGCLRRAVRRDDVPRDARSVASPSRPARTRSLRRRSASTASGRGGRRGR